MFRQFLCVTIVITLFFNSLTDAQAEASRQNVIKKWSNCSFIGGAVLSVGGAIQSTLMATTGFFTGAILAGASCMLARHYTGKEIPLVAGWGEKPNDIAWLPNANADPYAHKLPDITLFFNFDSFSFLTREKHKLQPELETLKNKTSIMITGYTCNIGDPNYNLYLSEMRAKSIRGYLIEKGLDPKKIQFAGEGMNNPIADNSTAEGRRKNRRVEINYD